MKFDVHTRRLPTAVLDEDHLYVYISQFFRHDIEHFCIPSTARSLVLYLVSKFRSS